MNLIFIYSVHFNTYFNTFTTQHLYFSLRTRKEQFCWSI